MTAPEILLLTATPRRLGVAEPLPVRVATRDGVTWEAVDTPLEEGVTLDLGRDLADFCAFPEVEAALDAWWSSLSLRPGTPVVVALPFACLPHGARTLRRWAARQRRPFLIVAECLLPVLEALPALQAYAEPVDVQVVSPSGKLHLHASRERVQILGREGEAAVRVEVGEPSHRLAEALTSGPDRPVQIALRPFWSLVEAGARRPLFAERPPRRTWQRSLHVRPGPDLDLVCSLGPAPADRARVARVAMPPGPAARVDLWLNPRRGRVRAWPGEFVHFPLPGLVS